MKAIHSMIAALGLAFVLAAPANAGVNDPEVIIYRFPGVRDDGGAAGVGIATVFHCSNFSGVQENIRFVTRTFNTTLLTNQSFPINHLATVTAATHLVASYVVIPSLNTNVVNQGMTTIAATSTNIVCNAVTIDASAVFPNGVALRGIRFSPVPGSEE